MKFFILLLGFLRLCSGVDNAAQPQYFVVSERVQPRSQNCLFLEVFKGSSVEALTLVYDGGKLDIEKIITSPSGQQVYRQLIFSNLDASGGPLPTIVKKGTKFMAQEDGEYKFCFNNQMAKWTAKSYTFEVTVRAAGSEVEAGDAQHVVKAPAGGSSGLLPEGVLTTAEGSERSALQHLGSLRRFSDAFFARLVGLEQDLQYHRMRSSRHHATLLSIESRVHWWSSVESGVVLLCAALQVWLVMRWFSGDDAATLAAAAGLSGSFSARGGAAGAGSTPRKGV
jgi:hypothetical protein